MRNRLLIWLLFFSLFGWGQVPDTNTFTLDTVVKVVNPATNDLSACFSAAVKANFDPLYDSIGYAPVNSLLRFRNYQASEAQSDPDSIKHGYLYNWYAVTDARNIAASGWHVPTDTEWTTLTDYLINNGYGYDGSGDDIAKSMAATTGWDISTNVGVPGNDPASNNSSGFSALPGGSRAGSGSFGYIGGNGYWWSSTEGSTSNAWGRNLLYYNTTVNQYYGYKDYGYSVRCLRDSTTLSHGQSGTYTGNDGKVYRTICIGTQEWLVVNLAKTKYRNGDTIPTVTDNTTWAGLTTGAKCAYNNDESNVME